MVSALRTFGPLFVAELALYMGVGLLNTLLSLRMAVEGFSTVLIGGVLTAYFVGLAAGSMVCPGLIQRVGHVRAFAAFAAVITATAMMHSLHLSAAFWGLLRFLAGTAAVGLYMVIESWLNGCSAPASRGRIFSVYMVLAYLGQSVGQQFLNLGDIRSFELFLAAGILLVLCLVPVAATPAPPPPSPPRQARPNPLRVLKRAPLGVLGCFASGLLNSAFYAMGPVFCNRSGLSVAEASWFMSAAIFGGLMFQWPVGIVSDRTDRTVVLPALGALIAASALLVVAAAKAPLPLLLAAALVFGGLLFTIYPVAVARTHDVFAAEDAVQVTSVLMLGYSIGALAGPLAASGLMALAGNPAGLFAYCSLVSAGYAATGWFLRRKERVKSVPVPEQVGFGPLEPK
jgi:MFS family permease